MPADSKTDLTLAEAKPISDGSSDCGITWLRNGGRHCTRANCNQRVRICKRKSPADTRVSEGGGGAALGTSAETPLQSVGQPVVRQLCFCSPWGFTAIQEPTCSPWRIPHWSRWMLEEAVTLWETCSGAGSWQDLWTHGERSQC